MLIREYGLFWERNEVVWFPGKGKTFRVLGRRGSNASTVRVADFRWEQGIYILYGNYGSYYVGLTKKQGLGKRLRDHLQDHHSEAWDRFSWFGFQQALVQRDELGLSKLKEIAAATITQPTELIREVEALLIKAMGPSGNKSDTKFVKAKPWIQVPRDEVDHYMAKVAKKG